MIVGVVIGRRGPGGPGGPRAWRPSATARASICMARCRRPLIHRTRSGRPRSAARRSGRRSPNCDASVLAIGYEWIGGSGRFGSPMRAVDGVGQPGPAGHEQVVGHRTGHGDQGEQSAGEGDVEPRPLPDAVARPAGRDAHAANGMMRNRAGVRAMNPNVESSSQWAYQLMAGRPRRARSRGTRTSPPRRRSTGRPRSRRASARRRGAGRTRPGPRTAARAVASGRTAGRVGAGGAPRAGTGRRTG